MSKAAITSLALLKVNWDTYQRSYTDNFAPLAAECIRKSNLPVVTLADVQTRMLSDFGLRIPAHSLKVILARLKKMGYVVQKHKTYIPDAKKLEKLTIDDTRRKVLAQHEASLQNLIEFCKLRYNIVWSEQEAEDALLSYLKEHDLDILIAATEGTPIPPVERPVPHAKFLVNAFAREISQSNPTAFAYLETIVKGHLLANVLVFPEVSAVTRKFRRTKVFFDTRLILNALGYGGPHYQDACKDLLGLLYEEGADLRCFRHTYDEVYGILDATARSYRRKAAPDLPASLALVFPGSSESDALLAMATLESDIARLRVKIEDKPPYTAHYQISETELDKHLQETIGYTHERARERDVDSLSAIYRLRTGESYFYIEDCAGMFVTTNTSLVKVSAEFFNSYQPPASAPICISDHHLTNILWLKKPMTVPDLPKKRIIADSYAAAEPSAELWRKFLAEVEKLEVRGEVTVEQYLLLRSSLEVRALLMDATLGDPDVIVEGTVPQILEAYNASIQAEADTKRKEAESTSLKLRKDLEGIEDRIENTADLIARRIGEALFGAFVVVLVLGAYKSYLLVSLPSWLMYVLIVFSLSLATVSLANLIWGTTVEMMIRRVQGSIRRFLTGRLKQLFLSRPREVGH
jgi:hypothetical protein